MLLKLWGFTMFSIKDTGKITKLTWHLSDVFYRKSLLVCHANILEVRCGRCLIGAN